MAGDERPAAPHPKSPDEWVAIADRELENISGSLRGGVSSDSVVYHSIRAVEFMLRAIIWKREGWRAWPGKSRNTKYIYRHDLATMLDKSGLKDQLLADVQRAASWQTILNASVKQYAYSPDNVEKTVGFDVARSVRYPDYGVAPWLRRKYQDMI